MMGLVERKHYATVKHSSQQRQVQTGPAGARQLGLVVTFVLTEPVAWHSWQGMMPTPVPAIHIQGHQRPWLKSAGDRQVDRCVASSR